MAAIRMEHLSRRHDRQIDRVLVVFDVECLPLVPDLAALEYAQRMFYTDQNYYPETLYKLIVINALWYFHGLFAVIKPWVDARTAARVVILGHDFLPQLLEYVDESQVPAEFGGMGGPVQWGGPCAEDSGCSPADIDALLAKQQSRETDE